jgi:hypothetical protein
MRFTGLKLLAISLLLMAPPLLVGPLLSGDPAFRSEVPAWANVLMYVGSLIGVVVAGVGVRFVWAANRPGK